MITNKIKFNLIFIHLILFIFIFIFTFSEITWAKSSGTTTANFLKSEVGSRPVAMGGAFVAIADDINSLYYNPSGVGQYQ
ncbi:hypothetical protein KKB54_02120, partial [bacterium]|nr:hypothetical protein [bacterium]